MQRRPILRLAALAAATVVLAAVPAVANASAPAAVPPSAPTARAEVAAMQPGWNLGNTFDSIGADETAWGNPRVTRALLKQVRAQGFRSIRIPVTWGDHQGAAPGYTIDPAWLSRVREVVGWALDEDLYVMINMHHDSWMWVNQLGTDHDTVLARYTATWTQIAAAFRDAPRRLVFESINEPQFSGTSGDAQNYQLMDEINTVFHRVVRASGGANATRLLVLPTLFANADQGRLDDLVATFTALGDPNVAATVHFYGFWPFSVNIAGFTRFDATTQQDLTGTFDRVFNAFVAKGIPAIIGEYGLLGFDVSTNAIEQGEKLKFFEFLGYYARTRGLTTMLWDNGQHFNRTTFQWNDPELYQQIRSSWTVRSGTAATDLLFVRKSAPVTDATVALNLNGNRLTSIVDGNRMLVRGRDYTVSADQQSVTFSAALLARLVGTQGYGVDAVLSARFSCGVPWHFRVRSYDTAVPRDATGTTDGLTIPTAFNGDLLATMEATYADGSGNAGPQNWTSYKEFGRAFMPDYTANTITMTPAFFAETKDGTVDLTLHFWSGATLRYTLVKSGTQVTGTA
ncbi:MAG TPA: cellulase family glycosylhydrolase [Rugosimonospora sp.]|nr:cellulase family glycosylhydrolase [Rugosimonospora sp.]